MIRPTLPSASSAPSFSPVNPPGRSSSSAAVGPGGLSASSPPSPTLAISPERPLANGIVASTSSGSLPGANSEDEGARSSSGAEGGGVAVKAAPVATHPLKGGLNSLHVLGDALPATSSHSGERGAAEYPLGGSAVYDPSRDGYYGAEGDEEGWPTTALGMSMGGVVPVSFGTGEKRVGNCKFFNAQKMSFGFINDSNAAELGNEEVFVHYTAILNVQGGPGGFKSLLEGEAVEYDIIQSGKGWQAQNVTGPNGAPCIGTPPGAVAKAPLPPYNNDRRTSGSYDPRNSFPRRPSGLTNSMASSNGRSRVGSGYYGSNASSTTPNYSSPTTRQVPLPNGQPSFAPSFGAAPPPNFQQVLFYPFPGGSPVQHPQAMLYPFPPPQLGNEQQQPPGQAASTAEGENGRPLQPGQPPPPGAGFYAGPPGASLPPGAVPIPLNDPRFPYAVPAPPPIQTGGFPLPGPGTDGSPYSAGGPIPYPISTSSPSASGGYPSAPPSAYPISSQTSPAGHFLHPYPPPPPHPHPTYPPSILDQMYADLGGYPGYPIGPYGAPSQQQQAYGAAAPAADGSAPLAAAEHDSEASNSRGPEVTHGQGGASADASA
ncbi:hypothetical protein JCM6882_009598 [Rhodosporidiobolus microsporus]